MNNRKYNNYVFNTQQLEEIQSKINRREATELEKFKVAKYWFCGLVGSREVNEHMFLIS